MNVLSGTEGGPNLKEIPSLPTIVECHFLDRISFTNYNRMKACLLKGLPARCIKFSDKSPVFLKSKAQMLGIFLHTMLERASELRKCNLPDRPSLFKSEFYDQLFKFEKKYSNELWLLANNSFSKLPEIGVIFSQISNIVFEKSSSQAKNSPEIKIASEKELTSKDGLLFGKIDALIENGVEKTIAEYKTGETLEGKYLKDDIYRQVHFYAELACEEYGSYPTYLMVLGPNQKVWRNSPDVAVSKHIGTDARSILNRYNSKVQNNDSVTSIAQVSSESCAGCQYQAFCPAYWAKCNEIELSEKIQSVKIQELGLIKGTSPNRNALKAKVLAGRLEGKEIMINGFFPKRFASYENKPGRQLMITDLILDHSNYSGRFIETSQIYNLAP
jgi:hypothetical protein